MDIENLSVEEIEEIFAEADPVDIPTEYIKEVILEKPTGETLTFTGKQFKKYLQTNMTVVGYLEISLDVDKFADEISEQTRNILVTIGQL